MPQAERESWLCLNGKWSFYKVSANGERSVPFSILVPFSPETPNSGVPSGFSLGAGETLVYTHSFDVSDDLLLGRTLLHFGAVDSACSVSLNGVELGSHKGGFTAFSFDVSDVIRAGENSLTLLCTDEATRNGDARGKQSDQRGGIWYTPQSGIWQSVWLESMPKSYIRNLKITPDAETRSVRIESDSMGAVQTVAVYDGDSEILRADYTDAITLTHPFELWSPENPKLYDIVITNPAGDRLRSYFGVRSFGQAKDQNGIARLTLNGRPYFFNGVLDQGYWSDGFLTYPSDEAAYEELKMLRDMGFNTVRKHIKIEPMRWYYHCDRLGLVVW
jgi:beta-galactosidase/beta-glucuronidase